jgi:hypothetical protein
LLPISVTFQSPVDDSYARQWLIFRCCDGNFRDPNCEHNAAWAAAATASGKMLGWTAYVVYRPGQNLAVLANVQHLPAGGHVMVDVESWGGQISGDHSAEINLLVLGLRAKFGDRVWAYGNQGDLASIYPRRGAIPVVVASYGGSKPGLPYMVGWQYTDGVVPSGGRPQSSAPFGACDHNELYVQTAPPPAPPKPKEDEMFHFKYFDGHYIVCQGKILAVTSVTPFVASLPDWGPVSKEQLGIWVSAFGPAVNH